MSSSLILLSHFASYLLLSGVRSFTNFGNYLLAVLREIMTVQLFYKYPYPEAQSSEDQILV